MILKHKIIGILLSLFVGFSITDVSADETDLYSLYYTSRTHASVEGVDSLSDEPYLRISSTSGPETSIIEELTQDLCITSINSKALEYVTRIFNNAEPIGKFSGLSVIAKIKFGENDYFTIDGEREMRDENNEARKLTAADFARLIGYIRALVDVSECL